MLTALATARCATAGCGDNGNLSSTTARQVTPGFFLGQTPDGEDLSIATVDGLGWIEPIAPAQRKDTARMAGDGSFAVEAHGTAGTFVVTGELARAFVTAHQLVAAEQLERNTIVNHHCPENVPRGDPSR